MSLAASLARRCTIRAAANARGGLPSTSSSSSATAVQRRFMGGGGGQPISRSMEAELWQGHPKEPEGWETTIYLTYAASAVILTFALGFAPDTSIKTVSDLLLHVKCTFQRLRFLIEGDN
jgi:hypothetical protein